MWDIATVYTGARNGANICCTSHPGLSEKAPSFSGPALVEDPKNGDAWACEAFSWIEDHVGPVKSSTIEDHSDNGYLVIRLLVEGVSVRD